MRKGELIGWKGILSNIGKFVPANDGLKYVLKQLGVMLINPDDPQEAILTELVDWYFSGNWIEVYEEDENGW